MTLEWWTLLVALATMIIAGATWWTTHKQTMRTLQAERRAQAQAVTCVLAVWSNTDKTLEPGDGSPTAGDRSPRARASVMVYNASAQAVRDVEAELPTSLLRECALEPRVGFPVVGPQDTAHQPCLDVMSRDVVA